MLLQGQGGAFHVTATVLHYQHLDYNSHDLNGDEDPIGADACENVEFSFTQFATIYFVEDLHEDETMENNRKMYSLLLVPCVHVKGARDIKKFRAIKHQYAQNYDLENTMAYDIAPHIG